jgi:hypothetical protein
MMRLWEAAFVWLSLFSVKEIGTAGVAPGAPANAYVAEDGTTFYVLENGTDFYVQES